MGQNELLDTITEIKELKILQLQISEQLDALEGKIKSEMDAQGIDKMLVGQYKVNYAKYKAKRFDTKAFKATHEALYSQYLKTTEARRFSIS